MKDFVDQWFLACVQAIELLELYTGISYEAWNLIIFVVLQPGLILLFAFFWLSERKRARSANLL